ncbi:MAG: L-rhamnose mutarotase [Candidatus Humimicrobiaceae bacterium]
MQRYAVFFRLKEESLKSEYKTRHQAVWREVEQVLKEAGYQNYSIWNYEDLLFGYYEIDEERAKKANKVLFGNEFFNKWRDYMEEIIYKDAVTGQKEGPMELMYYLP